MALSGITSGLFAGAMDSVMSSADLQTSPIPGFYFEVDFYGIDEVDQMAKVTENLDGGGLLGAVGSALMSATGLDNWLDPGEFTWHKAFIEVSAFEIGLEGKKTQNSGGDNYPIDLPDKMKNSALTLKRLIRPQNFDDKWTEWYKSSFNAMAYWEEAIQTKIVQVCIMHPHKESGSELILATMEFHNAYPSKVSWSALNSTSEDLLVEEIEISYHNADFGKTGGMDLSSIMSAVNGAISGALGGAVSGSLSLF